MDPTGSRLASLSQLSDVIARSSIPLAVVDLSDCRVLVINASAGKLFEASPPEVVGRAWPSLWDEEYRVAAAQALAALADGAIDSYRCRRRIQTPSGSVEVWLWSRAVALTDGMVAVIVVAPVGESDSSGRLLGTYFGPDAIEIAVGTVDRQSRRLAEIRPSNQAAIGIPAELASGTDLTTLVHPDDVERLHALLDPSGDPTGEAVVKFRLHQGDLGWTEIQCVALPTPPDQPLRVAFAPAAASAPDLAGDDRLADLEKQILRIAAELHAVSDSRQSSGAVEGRRPSLEALHPQQREIVDRLLRGERVSTIAEAMFLSPSTVRNHLSKVFKTFGVSSQAKLLALLRS